MLKPSKSFLAGGIKEGGKKEMSGSKERLIFEESMVIEPSLYVDLVDCKGANGR